MMLRTSPRQLYPNLMQHNVHGFSHRWSYIVRTIKDIEDLLQRLEDAIQQTFYHSTYWKTTMLHR